ncbi:MULTISPECIES: urease accessory protein UreD [Gordonia]|uniref:Urease accessory protein UreD n=1 Tax=Gordonia sihwensis NBRC 108236 TaxID=1223544 RepID=L7LEH2_9ACTN|nr:MULTISPECIES: urease accessory protein UreD [Gordonia]AUH69777.1 urease accessory protein [Gordonia sp. YC-JH1]MBY4571530.1 urease accessory protein [Gordonia sihwensis]GAC59515.1 urease accessory protein UreD [Gordonia sihwensis NBRC 108236]
MGAVDLPELAIYQDQPRQARVGTPGKIGALRMRFEQRRGRTVLADLYRQTPLLVQQALYWDEAVPDMACVCIVSTSGGVVQGDRLSVDVVAETDTRVHITTQSATKVQQMDANYAVHAQTFVLGDGAYVEYLPGSTIPHRNSRYVVTSDIEIAESATLLSSEIVLSGRKHHRADEVFGYDVFSSLMKARRPDGTRLFTEKILIEPQRSPIRHPGAMGRYDVFGNVVVLTPPEHAEAILARVPTGLIDGAYSGASRLPGDCGLIFKVLGVERQPVTERVRAFWSIVREEVLGAPIGPAQPWRGQQ